MFFVRPIPEMDRLFTSSQDRHSTEPREILIVEDERVSRRALTMLLAAHGYHTHAFETAEQALGWLANGRHPQVALVDLDLPGMNGLDLIDQLRKLTPGTVSVLVTATDQQTLENRLRHRPVCFFRKPLDIEQLLQALPQAHEN